MVLQRKVLVLILAGCLVTVVAGCPPGGFFGRYIVLNSSSETIHDLTISVADQTKTWEATAPGQGWIVSDFVDSSTTFAVTWTSESGESRQSEIDFSEAAGYHCTDDLIIEFEAPHYLRWRLVARH
jgi:hypothetical protein